MKKTIIIAAALVAMTACNKSLIEVTPSEGYGYINLGVTTDTEMVVTKGVTTTDNLSGYTINLQKDGVDVTGWPKAYTSIVDTDWKVPAGNYTIMVYDKARLDDEAAIAAVYASNDKKGGMYIYGETDVTVRAGEPSGCTVDCTVQNSKVSFASDSQFRDVFASADVEVAEKEGNRSLSAVVGESHLDANTVYFEPETLTWTLYATTELDGQERKYVGEVSMVKAKWSQVTFSTGNTDGQINVTINVDGEMQIIQLEPVTVDPFEGEIVERQ